MDIDLTNVGLNPVDNKNLIIIRRSEGFKISQTLPITSFSLFDLSGKLIEQSNVNTSNLVINFSDKPRGYYLLELSENENKKTIKLLW